MKKLTWLFAASLVVGCGGDGGSGPGTAEPVEDPGGLPGPVGNDNLYDLSNIASTDGALYQDVAAAAGFVYGCTGNAGITVAARGEDWGLTVLGTATVPDAKGCRTMAIARDGGVFATGQSDLGGSYLAQLEPGTTEVIASTVVDYSIESIAASSTHVFVLRGEEGLTIFGRNDGGLAEVGSLAAGFDQALGAAVWYEEVPEPAEGEEAAEPPAPTRIVVANGLSGLVVVDITDPTAPSIASTNKTYGTARRLVMRGDMAYIAQAGGGVSVLDMGSSAPFPPLASWSTHGSSVDIALTGDILYVANLGDLCVVDADSMELMGTERIPVEAGNPRVVGVDTDAGAGYAAEWNGLWTYAYAEGIEAPDIELSKTSVDFGLVSLKKGKGIIVKNLGHDTLEVLADPRVVDAAGDPHPDFSVDIEKDKFPPGQKGLLELTFEPANADPVEAWIELETNDPDEALVRIPIVANKLDGYQVGAVFDPNGELVFQEYKTGNDVTVKGDYAGKVVLMVWFASW